MLHDEEKRIRTAQVLQFGSKIAGRSRFECAVVTSDDIAVSRNRARLLCHRRRRRQCSSLARVMILVSFAFEPTGHVHS